MRPKLNEAPWGHLEPLGTTSNIFLWCDGITLSTCCKDSHKRPVMRVCSISRWKIRNSNRRAWQRVCIVLQYWSWLTLISASYPNGRLAVSINSVKNGAYAQVYDNQPNNVILAVIKPCSIGDVFWLTGIPRLLYLLLELRQLDCYCEKSVFSSAMKLALW